MKTKTYILLVALCALAGVAVISRSLTSPQVMSDMTRGAKPAQDELGFPGRGDDEMTSLGTFRIFVESEFRPLMMGYPGYDPVTFRLQSPTLFDPDTRVGRSDPHTHGSAADEEGTPVGTAGTRISDADLLLAPPDFQGPEGTREVHTEVRSLNLEHPSGAAVRAGIDAKDQSISPGEVESQSGNSGNPALDFHADSFFDVFAEIDIPAFGNFPGGTLFNSSPLLIEGDDLPQFPPRVIYTHGNSSAVRLLFKEDQPDGLWEAGDQFGQLVLAGHGAGFGMDDIDEFEQFMQDQPEMPVEPITAITLLSFTATVRGAQVHIAWETGTETDNAGFNLYRATAPDGAYTRINDRLIPARGEAASGARYSFADAPGFGAFYYKLEAVDTHGARTQYGPVRAVVKRRPRTDGK